MVAVITYLLRKVAAFTENSKWFSKPNMVWSLLMMCPLNLKNIFKCPKVANSILVILGIVDEFQPKINVGDKRFRCPLLALYRHHCGERSHGKTSVRERPCVRGSGLASDLPVASGRDMRLAMPAEVQGCCMERTVWSPFIYMSFCVWSMLGWVIFCNSILTPGWITLRFHLLWHHTKSLDNHQPSVFRHACVAMAKVNWSLGFILSWN